MLKPIIKWVGGKTQLLPVLSENTPKYCHDQPFDLIEAFSGGVAFSLWAINNLPNLQRLVINDLNPTLITTYTVVRDYPEELLLSLKEMQSAYHSLSDVDQKTYYYSVRERFNDLISTGEAGVCDVALASCFLFLNKTCFNGLYRVNSKGGFNVPIGSYKKPMICNEDEIRALSVALSNPNITLQQGDYQNLTAHITHERPTLFYFDPPYRPLDLTKNFTQYNASGFNDNDQIRLAQFCADLHSQDVQFLLSNSDPKCTNPDDNFFDDLFEKFNISRVSARRSVACNAESRKSITEILVKNY